MDNKVPQAQSLEVKTNGPSPSPSPMNWEPSPSPSQQSSASKRKAQVDNDAQMAIGKVLKADKSEAKENEMGDIVVKLPLPPGTFPTLWNADERYKKTYMSNYEGY